MRDSDKSDLDRIGGVLSAIPRIITGTVFLLLVPFLLFLLAGWIQHTYFPVISAYADKGKQEDFRMIGTWDCSVPGERRNVQKYYQDGTLIVQDHYTFKGYTYDETVTIGKFTIKEVQGNYSSALFKVTRKYDPSTGKYELHKTHHDLNFTFTGDVMKTGKIDSVVQDMNQYKDMTCVKVDPAAYSYLDAIKEGKYTGPTSSSSKEDPSTEMCERKSASVGGKHGLVCTTAFVKSSEDEMNSVYQNVVRGKPSVAVKQNQWVASRDESCKRRVKDETDANEKQIWYNQCIWLANEARVADLAKL